MMSSKYALLALAVFAACMQGCEKGKFAENNIRDINGKDSGVQTGILVMDLSGRNVRIVHPLNRFVSLAPSNTEILFALGAGEKLSGVTNFCDWPPGTAEKTKIGDLGRPDLEKILSLEPDCVLAGNKTSQEIIRFLSDNNIPVIVSEATSFDEIGKSVFLIGMLAGKEEEASGIVAMMAERLDALDKKISGARRVRCYYAVSFGDYGNWTAGPGSFLHDVITRSGGENLGAVVGKPWAEISLETLVTLNPDVILAGKYSGPDISL
ncbi:MAG: ABC transporter substrate-binding protein, partial [Spirochaetaceae bacterium]